MHLRISFYISETKAVVILIEIVLNLQITLGSINSLILSLSVYEHRMPFHVLRFSLISFSNVF